MNLIDVFLEGTAAVDHWHIYLCFFILFLDIHD